MKISQGGDGMSFIDKLLFAMGLGVVAQVIDKIQHRELTDEERAERDERARHRRIVRKKREEFIKTYRRASVFLVACALIGLRFWFGIH